ncbi:hypothetical protein QVD17_09261 [Tagetes erecta]|uniref:Uncharacterized protein n=1 Tax=Tagetes erecta TaxID=13708 RepID=A0AAD8KZ08_TARER|nr:hypothetical protein QVD17_09261 [Tagetes erecta]
MYIWNQDQQTAIGYETYTKIQTKTDVSISRPLHLNAPETMIIVRDILSKSSAELKGKRFFVYGEISSIIDNDWCYITCPICSKGSSKVDGKWFCLKDEIIDDAIYRIVQVINSIRTKMQVLSLTALATPQQLQVIPLQQAFSSVKRQLHLIVGEGSTSSSRKIAKVTSETAKASAILNQANEAEVVEQAPTS